MLRLVQVTDCHLSADPEADYRGQSPDQNLKRLEPAVAAFAPDWIVMTGDLSDDASEPSYRRIRDWAVSLDRAIAWLPGNHDERRVMAPLFADAGFEAGPVIEAGGWQLVLLDSAWPGRACGELDGARLEPLEQLNGDRPAGVFVHHQPVPVGAAWIDKVPLEAPQRFWNALEAHRPVRFVAFGHVHQRFRRSHRGVECLAAPSTVANSLSGTERFAPEPSGPLARWFVLYENGNWRSGYLGVGR